MDSLVHPYSGGQFLFAAPRSPVWGGLQGWGQVHGGSSDPSKLLWPAWESLKQDGICQHQRTANSVPAPSV